MMNILITIGVALFLVYEIWNHYVAVMHLKVMRDSKRITKEQRPMALLTLGIGYLLDVAVNWLICTPLFLELPKEPLVTQRVTRHKYYGKGWRQKLAVWICEKILDTVDPSGCHCRK